MAWLASAFSSIRARCPQIVRRRDLMMDESGGWLVMRRMSALLKKSCQRMSRIFRRHRWSTASIRCISTLLIAQHSDPQSIIGCMETLYRWSSVFFIINDRHKCWSRLCRVGITNCVKVLLLHTRAHAQTHTPDPLLYQDHNSSTLAFNKRFHHLPWLQLSSKMITVN